MVGRVRPDSHLMLPCIALRAGQTRVHLSPCYRVIASAQQGLSGGVGIFGALLQVGLVGNDEIHELVLIEGDQVNEASLHQVALAFVLTVLARK